jgi:hypothetical protein
MKKETKETIVQSLYFDKQDTSAAEALEMFADALEEAEKDTRYTKLWFESHWVTDEYDHNNIKHYRLDLMGDRLETDKELKSRLEHQHWKNKRDLEDAKRLMARFDEVVKENELLVDKICKLSKAIDKQNDLEIRRKKEERIAQLKTELNDDAGGMDE